MVKIYTLSHPVTNEIRYVGKTKFSLNDRLCKHLITKENNHRSKWIHSLTKIGLKPKIEILEEVLESNWQQTEQYWIAQLRAWNFNLVNLTNGGESGIISERCRKACIKANTGLKHSDSLIEKRISKISKPVIAFNTITEEKFEYNSASEASRKLNCCLSHITECCNKLRKTHKKFIFTYKD